MPGPIEDVTAGAIRGTVEALKAIAGKQAEVKQFGNGVIQLAVSDEDLAELERIQALEDAEKEKR